MPAHHRQPQPKKGPKLQEILASLGTRLWSMPGLDHRQREVLGLLSKCGTGELGAMQFLCKSCGVLDWGPLSCQDRHCPSCGVRKSLQWADARVAELLDVPYFHYVFTFPGELYPLFRENGRELYDLLMRAVQETLTAFSSDPRHLGGTPSAFSVLHTTNRRLGFHPHVHCVVAGAGWDEQNSKLVVPKKEDFLFPARALAASFRGRLLAGIEDLAARGQLTFDWSSNQQLADPGHLRRLLQEAANKEWNVRTELVRGDVQRVIRYLARYTHRTAISNARLLDYSDGQVTYGWTDGKTGKRGQSRVPVDEFVRRFAQHILPKGFKRIRFHGLLSPGKRRHLLPKAQAVARARADLLRFSHAVRCSLAPEKLPEAKCPHCGAVGFLPVAILRGNRFTLLQADAYPIPPPPGTRLTHSEAA